MSHDFLKTRRTEIAEAALANTDRQKTLELRVEKLSMRLVRDNDGHWCGEWLNDPYMEDHMGNIEGYLECYEAQLSYIAKQVFKAKELLQDVLMVREIGSEGPLKSKVREFLKSLERE